ncbi:poly glycohydrolase isoform [Mycena metata]|uniref:poly(ADP-ribose) glycohydrolase n=1 Tax=Mycena metata TaxID=1033252 RepID=A0AAD7K728_9AGAR|nr:poly glycohydrolase isoform [Mycena metata]
MRLLLPSSPETLARDRFSLTDTETDDPIPFWAILTEILTPLAQSTDQLIDALDSIACVAVALEMPILFPDGYLEPLNGEKPSLSLTPRQIACLVVHQFLCTLPKLPWVPVNEEENSQDLHIWFSGEQPHPKAVSAHLSALFVFFERIPLTEVPSNPVSLALCAATETPRPNPALLFKPISITDLETPSVRPSLLGLPAGACVISANSHIGFGRTASQEEMHVGCTPQSLPAKLFTPPLKDGEVMVLRGCEAVVELAGYSRNTELAAILPAGKNDWSRRTMLELTKACTAFASYHDAPYETIVTGHWGCGAFGGNKEIKSMIQWCAARMAGIELTFLCDKNDPFASKFRDFTSQILRQRRTVHDVLHGMGPKDEGRLDAFRQVLRILL